MRVLNRALDWYAIVTIAEKGDNQRGLSHNLVTECGGQFLAGLHSAFRGSACANYCYGLSNLISLSDTRDQPNFANRVHLSSCSLTRGVNELSWAHEGRLLILVVTDECTS